MRKKREKFDEKKKLMEKIKVKREMKKSGDR
jgi:hypothetical protein